MKKALLAVGIAICLMVAADKVYNFYQSRQPVAAVGECLSITDPNVGAVQIEIMKNDNSAAASDVVLSFEVMPGARIYAAAKVSYEELRGLNAQKVECVK